MKHLHTLFVHCRKATILLAIMLQGYITVYAQQNTDYALHANIIYRITKYISWPTTAKSGNFTIGLIGDSPLFDELQQVVAGKTVDQQKIIVTKIPVSATSFNCQILFVADEESSRFKKIIAKTGNAPVLILSESDGLAGEGSCINFVVIDDHLKLEISKKNIDNRNLKIASELLQLGIQVK